MFVTWRKHQSTLLASASLSKISSEKECEPVGSNSKFDPRNPRIVTPKKFVRQKPNVKFFRAPYVEVTSKMGFLERPKKETFCYFLPMGGQWCPPQKMKSLSI